LLSGLQILKEEHQLIGDVRGTGLFIGVELVRDRETLEPATREASAVVEEMKNQGILSATDGPFENVLKFKPPLIFSAAHADIYLETLDNILRGKR
jgi:4-aminobutyrate aminotransferase-like enzyme